jgi:murein DD-endopeptidase MepM/ murein hydrolase activator NlpD
VKRIVLLLLVVLSVIGCKDDPKGPVSEPVVVAPVITEAFGYVLNDYEVIRDTIKFGDTFGVIMDRQGVSPGKVFQIVDKVKDTFNVARIGAGKPYTILKSKDTTQQAQVFIYQPNRIDYVVVDFRDSIKAWRGKMPVSHKRKVASGIITSSLSQAMEDEGLSQALVHELSSVFQWTVDFFKLQKGDHFKVIYNEKYINDTIYAGIENIEATILNHYGRDYYGFLFQTDSIRGIWDYYDENANTLRSFFLKAPLQFSRISSRYSKNRFHPVQKRWKAHLGTDYAAPHGTPIMTTANGVVVESSYTSGNGNYVKVKHNNTYTTQYLHMSKRAVKVGERVKQGDVIGYVGSTGLATGPHVCYRFWYNGTQVDPYAIKLPAAEPIKEELKALYFEHIKSLKQEIDQVPEKTMADNDELAYQ